MDIAILAEKLAEIRGKFISLINEVNEATEGKPFYGRITLQGGRHLTGLIENLRVNEYKLIFKFTIEKLIAGEPVRKTLKKDTKISFEKFRGITPFQTQERKNISLKSK